MPARKQIQTAEKVPLKLTGTERTLVLEEVAFIEDGYKDIIRSTPNAKPLMMTLNDLDDFGGYIAAEANHCGAEQKQKKLDTIFEEIQRLLESHSDEEPLQSIRIKEAQKAMAIMTSPADKTQTSRGENGGFRGASRRVTRGSEAGDVAGFPWLRLAHGRGFEIAQAHRSGGPAWCS